MALMIGSVDQGVHQVHQRYWKIFLCVLRVISMWELLESNDCMDCIECLHEDEVVELPILHRFEAVVPIYYLFAYTPTLLVVCHGRCVMCHVNLHVQLREPYGVLPNTQLRYV